jgi:hypothetical protein
MWQKASLIRLAECLHQPWKIPQKFDGRREQPTRQFLVCNDTGSSVLTLFRSDLNALGFNLSQHSGALGSPAIVRTANGDVILPIAVDMQVLTSTLVPLTPWFRESKTRYSWGIPPLRGRYA